MKPFGIAGVFYLAGTWFSPALAPDAQLNTSHIWPLSADIDNSHSQASFPFIHTMSRWVPDSLSVLPGNSSSHDKEFSRPTAADPDPVYKLYSRLVPWVNSHSIYHDATVRLVQVDAAKTQQTDATVGLFHICLEPTSPDALEQYALQAPYQVWVSDRLVAAFPNQEQAERLIRQLRQLLEQPDFDATTLVPARTDDRWAIQAGDQEVVALESSLTQTFRRDGDLIAIDWANNLREVFGVSPLSLADAQRQLYGLEATDESLGGTASWYGPYFHKRLTANGERFDQFSLTAAHKTLPFGTFLEVTNARNGESVIVRINDRGPYVGRRSLDLSYQAAQCINSDEAGVVPYEAVMLTPEAEVPEIDPAVLARTEDNLANAVSSIVE